MTGSVKVKSYTVKAHTRKAPKKAKPASKPAAKKKPAPAKRSAPTKKKAPAGKRTKPRRPAEQLGLGI